MENILKIIKSFTGISICFSKLHILLLWSFSIASILLLDSKDAVDKIIASKSWSNGQEIIKLDNKYLRSATLDSIVIV